MRRVIKRASLSVLVLYLVYVLTAGVFSYAFVPGGGGSPDESLAQAAFLAQGEGPDRAVLVETPHDAFSRRIELIRSADDTLDFCCHTAKAGETVDCLFGEIYLAAERGVKVRILFDAKVGGMSGPRADIPLAMAAHPNIEYREFNPLNPLTPWKWNVVLHDKFLIADGDVAMLGGRNIGDEYFDPPGYSSPVTNDRDVMVLRTGPGDSVIDELTAYMNTLFNHPDTRAVTVPERRRDAAQRRAQQLLDTLAHWRGEYPEYFIPATDALTASVATAKISLISNPVTTDKKGPSLARAAYSALLTGTDVRIQSPYCTANSRTLSALEPLSQRGEVRILTNSTASSPNPPAYSNYVTQREKFVATGTRLFEYQSENSIHGKSALVDDRLSIVGSFNLDDRSMFIDTESALVIDSPAFNPLLSAEFDALFHQCAEVGADNRYLPGSAEIQVPWTKRLLMWIVSLFSRPFHFLI